MEQILVVDNDRVTLGLMSKFLEKKGYQVVTAENGIDALDVLKTYTPDVIFIDLVMPNIDGKSLCRIIRGMEKVKDVYLIILSAISAEEWVDISKLGANVCIAKGPFDEMSQYITVALDEPETTSERCLSGEILGVQGVCPRGITEELLSVKRHFEVILDTMSEGIIEINSEGRIVFASSATLSMIDIPEENLLGSYFVNLFSGDEHLRVCDLMKKMDKGTKRITEDSPLRLNKYHVALDILSLDEDEPKSLIILRDVSEHKHAEEALRESEEKYRTVIEANPDPVVVYDIKGKVIYFNPAFTRVFGWPLRERLGNKMDDFVPEEAWPETKIMIENVLAGETFSSIETCRYNKKREIIPVSISGAVYNDQNSNPIGSVISLRDISDQKEMETQLFQALKMEAMGTLAGGIAHDFNNLLMGIQGRTSLMLMGSDSSDLNFKHLKGIEDYVKDAADLTKQLLGFARGGKYEIKTIDLNELINKQNRMFGRTKKEIHIQEKLEENLWTVEGDRGQIEQVILNIFINAWQAMPEGGDLYIQSENTIIDEKHNKPYKVKAGRYVKISITDTGVGMDETTRQRIFDPFFTTKGMERGTGLGLASAYGIIKNHDGFFDVYSKKGEGTTFNIYFPASEKAAIKKKEINEELMRGTETVLLVDDEDMIIVVGKEFIENLGYQALIAKSGKEALEIYKKNPERIDMVILDIIMPDMGGRETYDKLKKINPDIKVLLSSGYSVNGQATDILNRGGRGFIQKPFTAVDLSKKLREILDKK
jgi:two-component system cell cycle sensor histidine kinase/response regulator CckA